jgi:RimJ/RimL family protein N-acetyltransferase
LIPALPEQFDALLAGDPARFGHSLDAAPPEPFEPPPLTDDVIAWFREQLVETPALGHWLFRWIVTIEGRLTIGSLGFTGPPDDDGILLLGYSVYPMHERRGYASEAAAALTTWALAQPGVTAVHATIKPANLASRRVAERAGMRVVGAIHSEEEGDLDLWECRGS